MVRDNVVIDGRVNGIGTSIDLTLINKSTSSASRTSVIRFVNDASDNTVKYCNLRGSQTLASSGILFFSTTTGSSGNDDNIINNNSITNWNNHRPC